MNEGRLFDALALQRYTLMLAQDPNGGLRDKPSKQRDFYHSCYNLGGLSVAQHSLESYRAAAAGETSDLRSMARVWGSPSNALPPVHLAFNIRLSAASAAMDHFSKLPRDHELLLELAAETPPVPPIDE